MGLGEEGQARQKHGAKYEIGHGVQHFIEGTNAGSGTIEKAACEENQVPPIRPAEESDMPRLEAILPERDEDVLPQESLGGGCLNGINGLQNIIVFQTIKK